MRFILALIPPNEVMLAYVQAAQQLFAPVSEGYLLSESSSPHITTCQFECKDEQEALDLWKKMDSIDPCQARFTGVSFVKGVGIHQEFYWAELSIARDEEIMKIHHAAVNLLQSNGYTCLNTINDLYRPHLTLARIRLPSSISSWPDSLLSNAEGPFELALGQADNNGQYLKTVKFFSVPDFLER